MSQTLLEEIINECELKPVKEIGPCPCCGDTSVRNDRGGTTCVACALDSSESAILDRRERNGL